MTAADVEAIGDEPCPVTRNLRISEAYHRISLDLAELLGGDDAPWTQFATWTSEDVGGAIRGEWTDRSCLLRLVRRVHPHYEDISDSVAAAFTAGNARVFAEVGGACVAFVHAVGDGPGAVQRFLDGLDPTPRGDGIVAPPVILRDAFAAYLEAIDQEGDERARSIALGNLCLAVVEQDRVQPEIAATFGAFAAGRPEGSWVRRMVVRGVTELVLEVEIGPGVVVHPGRHLHHRAGPVDLGCLRDDPRFNRFGSLLAVPDPDADRWTDLADRLRFIAALMSRYQQDPNLLGSCPFVVPEDCETIRAQGVPERFAAAVARAGQAA